MPLQQTPLRKVVIVGCGRIGALLSGELSRAGAGVVVIDRQPGAFDLLPPEFSGFRLTGDAVELDTLRLAHLQDSDCLLAVTPHDNINLLVTQVARSVFAVPRVLARVSDPNKEAVFRHLGIELVSTTRVTAERFLAELQRRPEEA
jgi:trk system potassium uptake protein